MSQDTVMHVGAGLACFFASAQLAFYFVLRARQRREARRDLFTRAVLTELHRRVAESDREERPS